MPAPLSPHPRRRARRGYSWARHEQVPDRALVGPREAQGGTPAAPGRGPRLPGHVRGGPQQKLEAARQGADQRPCLPPMFYWKDSNL
eukprot:87228-Pyramimonas_sp.AAC.1